LNTMSDVSFSSLLRGAFSPKIVQVFKSGYTRQMFVKDLFAGLTVGVVALPLALAFAIGAGATPAQGLYTAMIAGFVIALFGGCRYQVSGPTGAFVVVIAGVILQHGMGGLLTATLLAGIILVVLGVSGLGKLIKYIPYPVTTGFTTGIGLIIAGGQLKDFLGLQVPHPSPDFFGRIGEVVRYAPTLSLTTLAAGAGTIAIIILIRKLAPRIPSAVTAVALGTAVVWIFKVPIETVGSKYGQIPSGFPSLVLPDFRFETIRAVFPSAVTIALLGSIESLLSAVVADGMTGDHHDANTELTAQGIGNIVVSFFGGIPATGAIARTATNIKSGAQSPVSGVIHALVLLLFALFLSPVASAIPLASLSAVLLMVAWDMSDLSRFANMKRAPKSDLLVMVATFALTVAVDLTVAVEVGLLLAVFLFLRRISETSGISSIRAVLESDRVEGGVDLEALDKKTVPAGCEVYEIEGPFFFGTADRLQEALAEIKKPPKAFILRMRKVPAVDATGLNALAAFEKRCGKYNTVLILSGVMEQPRNALEKFGLTEAIGEENILDNIDSALARAAEVLAERNVEKGKTSAKHGEGEGYLRYGPKGIRKRR
jgi:sulfate permease, SulP family